MDRMRRNHSNGFHPSGMDRMDPRRELRESLPLCHPNNHDDYLKDFTPMSRKCFIISI